MSQHATTLTDRSVATRLGGLHVRTVGEGVTTILWPSMFVDSRTWDLILPLLPLLAADLLVVRDVAYGAPTSVTWRQPCTCSGLWMPGVQA